jgi:hypothetical protein
MWKLTCIFFFYLLVSFTLKAQDTIYRINGEMMVVEMLLISGDSLQFSQDGRAMSIANEGLVRVNYANGKSVVFSTVNVTQVDRKVVLLPDYPNVPIKLVEYAYFLNEKEISSKQVNKMLRIQNNKKINNSYRKLENTGYLRALGVGFVLLGAAIPIRSLLFGKNLTTINKTNGVKKDNTRTLAGYWAISGIFTIGLQTI